jgi:hypothetical protein
MANKSKKSKDEITTWMDRFRQTIAIFCGGVMPSLELCTSWIEQDDNALLLQHWVMCNTTVAWAQGISILDVAHVMAENPEEGMGHLDRNGRPMGI